MDTVQVDAVDPVVEIASLKAQVAAEEHNIACLDQALRMLNDHQQRNVQRLYEKRTKLRQLEHYTALAAEGST